MMASSDTPPTAPVTIEMSGPPQYAMDSDSDHKHVDTLDNNNDIELKELEDKYKKIKNSDGVGYHNGLSYQAGIPVPAFKKAEQKEEPTKKIKFTTLPSLKELSSEFKYSDTDFRTLKDSEQTFEKTIKTLEFYDFDELKEDDRLLYCKLKHNIGKFYLHIMDLPERAFEIFRKLKDIVTRGAIDNENFNNLVDLSIAEAECQLYLQNINAVDAHLNHTEASTICKKISTAPFNPKHDPYIRAYALYIFALLQSADKPLNSYSESIDSLAVAINILESLEENDLLGRALLLRASCYSKLSKFDAGSEFLKVLQYYTQAEDHLCNINYANAIIAFGDYQLQKEYSNSAMHLTPVINAIRQYKIALQILEELKLENPNAVKKILRLTTKTRDLIALLGNKIDIATLNKTIESLTNKLSTVVSHLNIPAYVQSFPHLPSDALTRVYDNKEENDDSNENNALIIQPLQEVSSSCSYIFGAFMNLFRSADQATPHTAAQTNNQTLSDDDEPTTITEHLSSCFNKYCSRI